MNQYIEVLENILRHPAYIDTQDAAALRAAIELMRAAEPKDPAAEREHCERVNRELWDGDYGVSASRTYHMIESERAAVRAECAAKIKHLEDSLMHEYRCANECQIKLSAAQAEIERLKSWNEQCERIAQLPASQDIVALAVQLSAAQAELATMTEEARNAHAAANRQRTELSAAQAEIERLQIGCASEARLQEECSCLMTKLTNLRTAAERWAAWLEWRGFHTDARDVRDAIEASK